MKIKIRIWNVLDKRQEAVLKGHIGSVSFVKIIVDDKYIISSSSDKTIRLWNFSEKTQEKVLEIDTYVNSLAATYNGKYVIFCSFDINCYIYRCIEKN